MVIQLPENWYIPSSATKTLTVGLAKGDIGDFRVPPAAQEGEIIGSSDIPLAIGVRNVGAVRDRINLRIRDLDGASIWTGSITLNVDEFGWVYPTPSYTMPARDLRLRAEAYHDTVVDSYFDRTIMVVVRVDTKITLELQPAVVEPGATYHYKGVLTRVDTRQAIPNMDVEARRIEDTTSSVVGSGKTGADGSYDIVATSPTAIGTFKCTAVFKGIVPFVGSSAESELAVGVIPIPALVWAALITTLGIGLYAYLSR